MQDRPSEIARSDGARPDNQSLRVPERGPDAARSLSDAAGSAAASARSRMPPTKILRKFVLGGLVLLVAGFVLKAGVQYILTGRFMIETDDAYVEADTTIIAPEATGTVAEVVVAENARVQAGDVLVRLVDADARARLVQAESAIATFKAALANTEARLKLQQTMIRGAEATVASARSDMVRTAADHERYARLHNDRITSVQRFEAARSEAEKGRAAFDKANAALESERQQVAVLATQRDQADAQIAQSEAQAEIARIELSRTIIRAPVSGVVGTRGVQVGQYVRPGTQLMAIVPIPLVRIVANFKETQIAGLKRGQSVQIHTDAWPDVRISGRVESLAPASGSRFSILPPENATGNFTKIVQRVPVRIAIDPGNALAGRLRPGLSVIVTIDSRGHGEGEHADLLVPPSPATAATVHPGQRP